MNKETILANLNLHAALPRLQELVRYDSEAKEIARDMNAVIRFVVNGGPQVELTFKNGEVKASRQKTAKADIGLFFTSADKLNRMFDGEKVIPIPYRGLTKFGVLKKFTRLTEIMPRYLKPTEADMARPEFRRAAVEMMLMAGLEGARELAEHDPHMEKTKNMLPNGTLLFKVLGDGPEAHVLVDNGHLYAVNDTVKDPSSTVIIKDIEVAAGMMLNQLDTYAALGNCDVRIIGLIPLADHFTALMDRVNKYFA